MTTRKVLGLAGLILLLGGFAPACDDASGACAGKIDGDLYALRLYNCTEGTMTVRVNDRVVGDVEGLDEYDVCGVADLGTFPQCSTGKIEAYAYNAYTETIWWNEDAVTLNPDGCWLVATIMGPSTDTSHIELPAVDPIDGPQCQYLEKESF